MVKIKKSIVDVKKLNAYLSHVYTSSEYPGSFSALDKLYREVKKQFPNVSPKDVQLWAKDNLSYAYTDLLDERSNAIRFMLQK